MQPSLQYTDEDRFIMDNVAVLSGLTLEQVKQVFEFTLLTQITQYLETKKVTIPYLGTVGVEYVRDEHIRGHKRAVLSTDFQDSELLKRIVGEIEDGENSTILLILRNFFETQLLYILEEDSTNGSKTQSSRRKRGKDQPAPRDLFGTLERLEAQA
jgi:hypothetical protein